MQQLSAIIKGLIPGLTERGKIKIRRKGAVRQSQSGSAYQQPEKLDHFLVTTLDRGKTNNFIPDSTVHSVLGPQPKEIPIRLLFDSIEANFQCRYACYYGRKLYCSGDGERAYQLVANDKAERKEVVCPCHRKEPTFKGDDGKGKGNGKCKINGTLSVLIDGAGEVGGVWKFRTTGYNSTVGILSSLALIRSLTGGILAGIPLSLVVQAKAATNPIDSTAVTVHVVNVIYKGSLTDLQSSTLAIAQGNADFRARLSHVEAEARRLISVDASLVDEAADITDEFYPEDEPAPILPAPAPAAPIAAEPVTQAQPQTEDKPKPTRRRRAPAEAVQELAGAPVEAAAETEPTEAPAPAPTPAAPPAIAVPAGMDNIDLF